MFFTKFTAFVVICYNKKVLGTREKANFKFKL